MSFVAKRGSSDFADRSSLQKSPRIRRGCTLIRCGRGWLASISLILSLALMTCAGPVQASGKMIAHPDRADAAVEYFVRRPSGTGPWPTLVFLHGHQRGRSPLGGTVFVNWGALDQYARRGFLAVSVSLPGPEISETVAFSAGFRCRTRADKPWWSNSANVASGPGWLRQSISASGRADSIQPFGDLAAARPEIAGSGRNVRLFGVSQGP